MEGAQNKVHATWSGDGERSIVLYDDNPDDGYLITRQLKNGGIGGQLQFFGSAGAARAYLSKHPASLLIVALNNRSEAGFELLNWVRSQPQLHRTLIVAAGESSLPADIQRAYDLGINAYYTKGIDFNGFPEVLKELIFV